MSEGIESGFSRMKSQVDDLIEKIVAKSSERIRTHITILVWKIICYRYCGS